jgi:hypothetical protein
VHSISKSARLQQEINEALSGANKKQEDVTCVGIRFPGQWKNLGPSSINAIPAILLEFVFFEFVFVMNVPTVNNIYGSVLIFLPACFFTWLAFRLHSLWARKRRMIDSGLVPP